MFLPLSPLHQQPGHYWKHTHTYMYTHIHVHVHVGSRTENSWLYGITIARVWGINLLVVDASARHTHVHTSALKPVQ